MSYDVETKETKQKRKKVEIQIWMPLWLEIPGEQRFFIEKVMKSA